jgi:hypothetical protein
MRAADYSFKTAQRPIFDFLAVSFRMRLPVFFQSQLHG